MTSSAPNESNENASAGPPSNGIGRVGGYTLLVEIASGGMATVYLAKGPDGKLTALKRPHPHLAKDPIYTSMLLDEARLASAIHHPNVVRVRELGFEGELPFIVMDYVEGSSLVELRRDLAAAGRALDVPVAVRIVLDALAGLHAAHVLKDEAGRSIGIIHRDVSPHNVLVGSDGVARLTDFGIAKAEDRVQTTRTHEVKGKLSYIAPERVDHRRLCTIQSDVFSMAVVLWECLAGRRLFKADEPAHVLDAVLHSSIPALRRVGAHHVSPELDAVIARGLSRDLRIRYANAAEFAVALERVSSGRVGEHEDVARVIETVFSPRLRVLQESVRRVLGEEGAEQVLFASGLRVRPRPSPSMPLSTPEIFGAIGTEVASDRYAIGELPEIEPQPRRRWPLYTAIAVGVVVGVAGLTMLGRREVPPTAALPSSPAPILERAAPPVTRHVEMRHVEVQLPFAASQVAFDDEERTVIPPTNTLTFDVPAYREARHRLVAVGEDGASAEGTVVEENGVVRGAPSPSFVVRPGQPSPTQAPASGKGRNIGTRRNGFTKLK